MPDASSSKAGEKKALEPRVPRWIPPFAYAFVLTATVALLVLHTIGIASLEIDTTTLGLLALLLLIPLAPHIRRLSAAGVAAEIGAVEARELQAEAAHLPAAEVAKAELSPGEPSIQEQIDRDPPLGLAQLRIELEKELRRLHTAHLPDVERRSLSLGAMAGDLRGQGVLPADVADPLANAMALANRAVHGEYVPTDVAAEIGKVGLRVLAALREIE